MKNKLALALVITSLLLALFFVPAQASANATVEVEVTGYDALVFEGDRAQVAVTLSNVGDDAAYDVTLIARNTTPDPDVVKQRVVGTLNPNGQAQVTLLLEGYSLGKN